MTPFKLAGIFIVVAVVVMAVAYSLGPLPVRTPTADLDAARKAQPPPKIPPLPLSTYGTSPATLPQTTTTGGVLDLRLPTASERSWIVPVSEYRALTEKARRYDALRALEDAYAAGLLREGLFPVTTHEVR